MTQQLSPAAQSVLSAFEDNWEADPFEMDINALAAAIRVISEFIRMDQPLGDTDADAGVFTAHQFLHGYIAGIADELKALYNS